MKVAWAEVVKEAGKMETCPTCRHQWSDLQVSKLKQEIKRGVKGNCSDPQPHPRGKRNDVEEHDECPICKNNLKNGQLLCWCEDKCGKAFHADCMERWFTRTQNPVGESASDFLKRGISGEEAKVPDAQMARPTMKVAWAEVVKEAGKMETCPTCRHQWSDLQVSKLKQEIKRGVKGNCSDPQPHPRGKRNDVEEHDECPICKNNLKNGQLLCWCEDKCGKAFHADCMERWFTRTQNPVGESASDFLKRGISGEEAKVPDAQMARPTMKVAWA
jgi:negative regulator of replication initiation